MASSPMNTANAVNPFDVYSDSRTHGYQGPSRYVRFPRITSAGGGCIDKSGDGIRCAVAGKESLRILRISDGSLPTSPEFRSFLGRGGHRIEATRNLWEGSGLKIESTATGVAWGRGPFSNKIFTSARNGELIMWDVGRAGTAKLERRTKDHIRSINQLSISHAVHHYCVTGSADGDLRIWDLRDMSKSLMRVHHPTSVRSVSFSPSLLQPLQAIVGLDNGSIYRWDLKMGQRGLLDRLLVAHTTPVTSLAWRESPGASDSESPDNGMGWFASGGLDRCVKVWDLTGPSSSSHIPSKPTYTLHPRFPVKHVLWRPGHDCEIAVISNPEFASTSTNTDVSQLPSLTPPFISRPASTHALDSLFQNPDVEVQHVPMPCIESKGSGFVPTADDTIEIWDVRRGWVAKWSVRGSGTEGSLTDIDFADSHAIWTLHSSGAFSQFDLRDASRPIDSVERVALTWEASGSATFVSDRKSRFEVPYDDIRSDAKPLAEKLKMHIKTLGDPQIQPQLQNVGTQVMPHAATDLESFKKLAKKYILAGESRKLICIENAQAASEAGKEEAAQLWVLLAACLEDVVPQLPPAPPQIRSPQGVYTHSLSTPASARHSQSYFPLVGGKPLDGGQPQKTSPGRGSVKSTESTKYPPQRSSSRSASRHLTPASSASSSPRHGHVHLPPITPRRPSFLGQRTTGVDLSSSGRRPSTYRRPSIVASVAHATTSPVADKDNKPSSSSSLRHVGEGALDDSDSSSGNDSDVGSAGTAGNWSDNETSLRPPLLSPTLLSQQRIAAPSPLSRVAGRQRWTDEDGDMNDDDGATSASPQSTDTDSDSPVVSLKRQTSGRRVSGRYKSRSRSSTVASLAASTFVPLLSRQDSVSSIRTVVAGDVAHGDADGALLVKGDETIRDISSRIPEVITTENAEPEAMINFEHFTERRIELVQAEEKQLREVGWRALRHALETLADNGDVQMCAMLVILARFELRIGSKRSGAFVEAYIDILDRLRMFPCSAYIRKYCQLKDVQEYTMTHTSISTSCERCYKPLLKPSGRLPDGVSTKGGYARCQGCKSYLRCSLCRLPVRTLYFQCPVCRHGAHEKCHRQMFEDHRLLKPIGLGVIGLLEWPEGSLLPAEDKKSEEEEEEVYGYPCPTGCGHICFPGRNDKHEWLSKMIKTLIL